MSDLPADPFTGADEHRVHVEALIDIWQSALEASLDGNGDGFDEAADKSGATVQAILDGNPDACVHCQLVALTSALAIEAADLRIQLDEREGES